MQEQFKDVDKIQDTNKAERLFRDWQETIIWSCLQGIMGSIYAEDTEEPASAVAILGDFCFLAGKPDSKLLSYKPEECKQNFIIMVPQSNEWADLIEKFYGEKAKKVMRYATKKEGNIFDRTLLQNIIASLKHPYSMKRMDRELFQYCAAHDWSRDLVSQYSDYEEYERLGLGIVILDKGVPVSGASSYTRYETGIEVEIDTKEEYRRKGLASVCGAGLILECMDRELYPSWDAQNKWSLALAEKLGYHFDYEYPAYEIWGW